MEQISELLNTLTRSKINRDLSLSRKLNDANIVIHSQNLRKGTKTGPL